MESVVLADNPRSPFGLSETLGVAMRNHVFLFDDAFGRSVIGWSAMVIQHRWPSCRSCLADQRASISGGQESSGHYANIWRQETVGARRLKVYFI